MFRRGGYICFTLLFTLIAILVLQNVNLFNLPIVNAVTEQEIQAEKSAKQKELAKILSDIKDISNSKNSISVKLSQLKNEKKKMDKLISEMEEDLKTLQLINSEQETQLISIEQNFSKRQALLLMEAQKNVVSVVIESQTLRDVIERVVLIQLQYKEMNDTRDYLSMKSEGVAASKIKIEEEKKQIKASQELLIKQITTLEIEEAKLASALSKGYTQRNFLVSDIAKLTKKAQDIVAKKARTVPPPSGSGSGGGSSGSTPNPNSNIYLKASDGTVILSADKVIKINGNGGDLNLKGLQSGTFPGSLIFDVKSGLYAINEATMDQYLYGLAEMPSSWNMDALKAQAIAGRSYATYKVRAGGYGKFDIYDSVRDQEYVGLGKIYGSSGSRWKQAVDETSNKVLKKGSSYVQALYSAEAGGHTLSSSESPSFGGYRDYLLAKSDRFQKDGKWVPYGEGPYAHWQKKTNTNTMALMIDYINSAIRYDQVGLIYAPSEMTSAQLSTLLGNEAIEKKVGTIESVVEVYNTGGSSIVENTKYTKSILITGSKGTKTVSGSGFKAAYNVRSPGSNSVWSTLYDIKKVSSNSWEVWSRGYGHRVGMSQYGAQGRANAGQSYSQILSYYYNGANIVQYNIGRNIRVGLAKFASKKMTLKITRSATVYKDGVETQSIPAGTYIIEYK